MGPLDLSPIVGRDRARIVVDGSRSASSTSSTREGRTDGTHTSRDQTSTPRVRASAATSRGATDRLLEEIAASFEDVWRERADLADKVEQLEADLVRYRELEALLRTTLVSAERASAELQRPGAPRGRADPRARRTPRRAKIQRDAIGENERLVARVAPAAAALRRRSRRSTTSRDADEVDADEAEDDGQNTWPG